MLRNMDVLTVFRITNDMSEKYAASYIIIVIVSDVIISHEFYLFVLKLFYSESYLSNILSEYGGTDVFRQPLVSSLMLS